MKIVSPDIVHKTDAAGVIVNISRPEARTAFRKIFEVQTADIKGIYIQKMAPKIVQVCCRCNFKTHSSAHTVMF